MKTPVLEELYRHFRARHDQPRTPRGIAFRDFVAAGGEALFRHGLFEALQDYFHDKDPDVYGWPAWPPEFRDPGSAAVREFAETGRERIEFFLYLQWLADGQLGAAGRRSFERHLGVGLYQDLAVGVDRTGVEVWANPSIYAVRASIGAPPDDFNPGGQNWGLSPWNPDALVELAYEPFIETVRANMRHAGALRIDHVMGLARLFWIPEGAKAIEGAYVRYPFEDLLGVLSLESRRARCLIVGEDLGTVPEGFRERLDAADVLSYRVLWFERDGTALRAPEHYPAKAVACVSTHDLPTIRGWWNDAAPEERRALGLAGEDGAAAAQAMHRFIGATPCAVALLQADDLAAETIALNQPGTDRERPNWRRKVGVDAASLWKTPIGVQATRDLGPGRGTDS